MHGFSLHGPDFIISCIDIESFTIHFIDKYIQDYLISKKIFHIKNYVHY